MGQADPAPLRSDAGYRYAAFVSYRHVEPDRTWAAWLHAALETYTVPAQLRAEGYPRRLGKLFRDNEELTAAPDLGAEIEAALRASRFLIVVCSPATPLSSWVDKEIRFFRALGRGDRILALLIAGQPGYAFPRSLGGDAPEALAAQAAGGSEPLAADVRPVAGTGRRLRRRLALLRIASRLLGCSFDDLRRRDAERRRRRFWQAGLGAAVVLAALLGAAGFGLYQQDQAARMKILRDAADEQRVVADRGGPAAGDCRRAAG